MTQTQPHIKTHISFDGQWVELTANPSVLKAIEEKLTHINWKKYWQIKNSRYAPPVSECREKAMVCEAQRLSPTTTRFAVGHFVTIYDEILQPKKALPDPENVQVNVPIQEPAEIDLPKILDKLGLDVLAHQTEARKALLNHKRGQIILPTGTGKTCIVATSLHHFPDSQILVMVPRIDMQVQMVETLEFILGEKIGRIGGGKTDIQRVSVGIYKSVLKKDRKTKDYVYRDYLNSIQFLIIDEAHEEPDNQVVLGELCPNAYYRIALTASPQEDERAIKTRGVTGSVIYEASRTQLEDRGIIMRPTIFYIEYTHDSDNPYYKELGLSPGDGTDQIDFGKGKYQNGKYWYYNHQGKLMGEPNTVDHYRITCEQNWHRNEIILTLADAFINWKNRTGPGIVFTGLVDHARDLSNQLNAKQYRTQLIYDQTPPKERERYYDRARKTSAGLMDNIHTHPDRIDLLLASGILNAGVDIRPAQCGFFVEPTQNPRKLNQRAGRQLRIPRGKEVKNHAIIIVMCDKEELYFSKRTASMRKYMKDEFPKSNHINASVEDVVRWFEKN